MARVGHNNNVFRECLVDCYWKSVDFERANRSWMASRSIPVCDGTLTNNGFVLAAKNTICTEISYSYACIATKGTCMEVSRGTETYPQTASRL